MGTATLNFNNGVLAGSVASTANLGGSGASFTGATIVGPGMTVSLTDASSTALANTSSITLNSGTFTIDGNAVHVGTTVPIVNNGDATSASSASAAGERKQRARRRFSATTRLRIERRANSFDEISTPGM